MRRASCTSAGRRFRTISSKAPGSPPRAPATRAASLGSIRSPLSPSWRQLIGGLLGIGPRAERRALAPPVVALAVGLDELGVVVPGTHGDVFLEYERLEARDAVAEG